MEEEYVIFNGIKINLYQPCTLIEYGENPNSNMHKETCYIYKQNTTYSISFMNKDKDIPDMFLLSKGVDGNIIEREIYGLIPINDIEVELL